MSGTLNFNSLDFSDVEKNKINRELIDHLFMLKEQLEYTLSNLGTNNWNQKELEIFAEKISVKGAVTFEDLANGDKTVINGAYIKSGVVEASTFRTFTEQFPISESEYYTETYGTVGMYYIPTGWTRQEVIEDDVFLAGGLKFDDDGLDKAESARFRLWLYTRNFGGMYGYKTIPIALKLSSEYRASLEATEQIYIKCSSFVGGVAQVKIVAGDYDENEVLHGGVITLEGGVIRLNGSVYVNGEQIS